jgi:hypothetical protein
MQASIFHPHQAEHLGCSVRDMSQDGALLDFPRPKDLPSIFWLRLDGDATLRLCTVVWRTERRLGVEFSEQINERRRAERWAQAPTWPGSRPPDFPFHQLPMRFCAALLSASEAD